MALAVAAIILQSCGGVKREYDAMPPGEHFEIIYGKMLKAIGGEEPDIYEMSGEFKPGTYSGSAHFKATVHGASNKDKMTGYGYGFEAAVWTGPDQVTLYTNEGDLSYEEYKEYLFKRDQMPAFSTFTQLYEKAIAASGFAKGDCHVSRWEMDKFEGTNHFQITVKMNEGGAAKTSIFDMSGNIIETVDGENSRD